MSKISINNPLLGAHMSIEGGFYRAIERGESIGCTAIQIFTKSNRQWNISPLTPKAVERFLKTWSNSSIQQVVAHASYLLNLASQSEATRARSLNALIEEVERCTMLHIPYLVIHPGSSGTQTKQQGLDHVVDNLRQLFDHTSSSNVMILLETMAGQGNSICSRFEDLAFILSFFKHENRLGVCLDTCHIFAAGYDIRTQDQYQEMWNQFNAIVGKTYLKAIHLNDSKKECGTRVDRHEEIGKGKLGEAPFSYLMNDTELVHVPKLLEIPKKTLEDDARNLEIVRNLIKKGRE